MRQRWFSLVRMLAEWSIVLPQSFLLNCTLIYPCNNPKTNKQTNKICWNSKSVTTSISWLFIIRHNKRWSAIMRQRWFSPVRMSAKWSIALPRGNCFAWSTWNFTIFLSSALPVPPPLQFHIETNMSDLVQNIATNGNYWNIFFWEPKGWSMVLPRGNCFAWSTWNFTIFLSSAVPVPPPPQFHIKTNTPDLVHNITYVGPY